MALWSLLFRVVFLYILALPFVIAYQIVRVFTASTSSAQLPAHIARRLAKQGKSMEAGRWYLEMLSSDAYERLLGISLFGPRNGEVARFLKAHGDNLPSDLREVLANVLWADAFLKRNQSHIGDWASDNPSLIDLAGRLVAWAHKPKEPDKLNWLRDCAQACEHTAPQLATVLRQELTLTHKYPLRPADSPVRPNREPATEVRTESGPCCLCGHIGTWKGLDVYAKVSFYFQQDYGTSSSTLGYHRYIGWFESLFCDECRSNSFVQASLNRWRRFANYSVVAALCSAVSFVALWASNSLMVWGYLLSGTAAVISLIILAVSLSNVLNPGEHEKRMYLNYVNRFIVDAKQELLSACDLTGSVLHFKSSRLIAYGCHTPTHENVSFVVEPSVWGKALTDDNSTEWIGP